MRIRAVELCRLELVLLHAMQTSNGEHSRRPVIIVRVITDEGEGYGECSALAEPLYTEEYADGAEAVLGDYLIPRLMRAERSSSIEDLIASGSDVRGHAMAKAGLEMALLDAYLQSTGESLARYIGATQSTIAAGANIGLGHPDDVIKAIAQALDAGYQRVKCKIAPGDDLSILHAVRSTFPDIVMSVDANGAYDYADEDHRATLRSLDEFSLVAIEQPLGSDELIDCVALSEDLDTPILLDESITSMGSLRIAILLRACDGISLKPPRVGGILVAKAMHDLCRANGLHLAIGGMLETGIGRAAALAVGGLPGFDLPGDLGGSERYFAPDLTMPYELDGSSLVVPNGPGLGVTPLASVIASARVRGRVFQAS